MSDEVLHQTTKDLKEGKFILIDNEPCKIVEMDVSAPGKHGSAKVRIVAIGLFDNQKRTLVKPSGSDVDVPIITKKRAQVVSITGDNAQLMDMDTYETYELPIPQELKDKIKAGQEVEVLESMGKRLLSRILGE